MYPIRVDGYLFSKKDIYLEIAQRKDITFEELNHIGNYFHQFTAGSSEEINIKSILNSYASGPAATITSSLLDQLLPYFK